ncbi:MAG TPA: hypothetical protein VFZ48_03470 [Candidatus Saccharimonadales bacterium]
MENFYAVSAQVICAFLIALNFQASPSRNGDPVNKTSLRKLILRLVLWRIFFWSSLGLTIALTHLANFNITIFDCLGLAQSSVGTALLMLFALITMLFISGQSNNPTRDTLWAVIIITMIPYVLFFATWGLMPLSEYTYEGFLLGFLLFLDLLCVFSILLNRKYSHEIAPILRMLSKQD